MSEEGAAGEITRREVSADRIEAAHYKDRLLIWMLVYSALCGVFVAMSDPDAGLDLILGVPLLAMGILWCLKDARERGRRVGRPMRIGLLLLFVVAFPIYLLQSRGLRGFGTLLQVIFFIGAMMVCEVSTAWLTWWVMHGRT